MYFNIFDFKNQIIFRKNWVALILLPPEFSQISAVIEGGWRVGITVNYSVYLKSEQSILIFWILIQNKNLIIFWKADFPFPYAFLFFLWTEFYNKLNRILRWIQLKNNSLMWISKKDRLGFYYFHSVNFD